MQQLDGLAHGRHGGGHECREAGQLNMLLNHAIRNHLRVNITPKVDDVVAIVLQQHTHDVLANVVDVALHCCQNDLALAGHIGGVGGIPKYREAGLCRLS